MRTLILTQNQRKSAIKNINPNSRDTTFDVTIAALTVATAGGGLTMKNHQPKKKPVISECSGKTPKTELENVPDRPIEVGGPKGPEPTRYGDWEKAGRCTDF